MSLPIVGELPGDGGELVVLADALTVQHRVALGWVTADLVQGDTVGEIADDVRDQLLRTGKIGRRNGAPYVHAPRRPIVI
jgi:hypothetical protein